jgi:hypothetical protein
VSEEYAYAVQYENADGRWVTLAVFRRPLDADRAFQLMVAMRPERPVQQIRFKVVSLWRPQEE